MFDIVALPVAALRWQLTGPAGQHLDTLVAQLIGAGATVDCIARGTSYRLAGDNTMLQALAAELALHADDGFTLQPEPTPADVVALASHAAPVPPFRRSVTVHGLASARVLVARAVDRGLTVTTAGVNRWSVAGRSAALLAWLAATCQQSPEEVMAAHGWTTGSVAAEDSPVPPFKVDVQLPTRRIVTDVMVRNVNGDLTRVEQRETTVES